MKKVLLVGNGAREHVIAETLKRSGARIYTFGKARNPGLLGLSEEYETGSLKDFDALRSFTRSVDPDFAVIGPDDPIADGAADMLLEMDIKSVAPLKTVARLESSKSFTRDLLEKHGIKGNPLFKVFYEEAGMKEFLNELGDFFVVKADGLMGGKGVKVAGDHLSGHSEAIAYAKECLAAGGRVVIEEKLVGQEFSLMSFCDGKNTIEMPAVQDHKRAYDGDKGPNTGGMGSYSDADHLLPFLNENDIAEASVLTQEVAAALLEETGSMFKGIMYGGFIATANGIRLIEYNARFGDPEAMNVLPILKTNFVEICEAIINGDLDKLPVEFENRATVCKYIVPEGYPENSAAGERIEIGRVPEGVKMYYASVDASDEGIRLSNSRAVAFVGIGETVTEAEKIAASACDSVRGPVFYRKDIGTSDLIDQRIAMMKSIRG
ncbi:phosphoribosylamine--glycine ligase [Candidatus Peregrinibacteria bacterium]|nr:phosphoribosylamine--glycine ligase [Candidatus Peregrinibacteria bacterium]